MMISRFWAVIRWLLRLGVTFLKVLPFQTVSIVAATLVAQVTMLVATLLPLKIILLLGAERVPSYFPAIFSDYGINQLILFLLVATLAFYGVHLISQKMVSFFSVRGGQKLIARTQKMSLFENQDEVASNGYRTYARALSGGVFTLLVIGLIFWLYRSAALFIVGYIFVSVCLAGVLYVVSSKLRTRFISFLPGVVEVLTTVGFLAVFGFIVARFMLGHSVPLLPAVVTMLLSRQMFSQLSGVVSSVIFLLNNRIKLNSLFFHTQVYVEREHPQQEDFFTRFVPETRDRWMRDLLKQFLPGITTPPVFEFRQSGMPGVVVFLVTLPERDAHYMLRFYAPIRKPWALNEADLLTESSLKELPSPVLLASAPFEDIHVNLFELPQTRVPSAEEHRNSVSLLNREMMALDLPAALVTRFARSRPMLASRIECGWIDRLRVAAADERDNHLLRELGQRWDHIVGLIRDLPVMLINQQIGLDNMLLEDSGSAPLILGWGQWIIEPVGFSWSGHEAPLKQAVAEFEEVQVNSKKLGAVDAEAACLVARMKEFESLFQRQLYRSAIDFIPNILENVSRCKESDKYVEKTPAGG